jgi:hypothetical protein
LGGMLLYSILHTCLSFYVRHIVIVACRKVIYILECRSEASEHFGRVCEVNTVSVCLPGPRECWVVIIATDRDVDAWRHSTLLIINILMSGISEKKQIFEP